MDLSSSMRIPITVYRSAFRSDRFADHPVDSGYDFGRGQPLREQFVPAYRSPWYLEHKVTDDERLGAAFRCSISDLCTISIRQKPVDDHQSVSDRFQTGGCRTSAADRVQSVPRSTQEMRHDFPRRGFVLDQKDAVLRQRDLLPPRQSNNGSDVALRTFVLNLNNMRNASVEGCSRPEHFGGVPDCLDQQSVATEREPIVQTLNSRPGSRRNGPAGRRH
jgi:hypothetical protein